MIDLYDKLSNVCSGKKFCIVDECLKQLEAIHLNADRNFHHPILNQLKTMFMFECDILLNLLQVHTSIQNWKFLDSMFLLQEAHNKLNMMANKRDNMINNMNNSALIKPQSANLFSPLLSNSAATNNASAIRRNLTNSSLSSSGSSNLSVLLTSTATNNGSTNHSPILSTPLNHFNYSNQYSTTVNQQMSKMPPRNFNSTSMPILIQWLNRYKLFLLSKYSFYFHSLLIMHLAPISSFTASIGSTLNYNSNTNYSQMESTMIKLCSKHLYDFHVKIVQFVRKMDPSNVILIFDTHDRDEFSLSGYRSPYLKKEIPKGNFNFNVIHWFNVFLGINSLPIIYSYPDEFSKYRIPSLIMIMNRRNEELNSHDSVVIEQDKPSDGLPPSTQSGCSAIINNNQITTNSSCINQPSSPTSLSQNQLPNATYFLVKPDPDFIMALICEQKKMDKDTHIVTFMQEMTTLLKGAKIFASLRNGK